jgi:hypothetical protein
MQTTTTSTTCIDRFLDAVAGGEGIPTGIYTDDAVLDATVPGWRFRASGPAAVTGEYARWFASPGRFEELERRTVDDGEVVTYLLTWEEAGVPHAAHHCHVLVLDAEGRIARDAVFCGGRWSAELLAEMEAAAHAG